MPSDNRQRILEAELRRALRQKIAYDLAKFYEIETEPSPSLQAVLKKLKEQPEEN